MGIAPITFTEVKRPQGHGKIEAFNHLLTNAFVAEVAASEIRGICLVSGPSGVGKSITLRRFIQDLHAARYRVVYLPNMRTTETGFLRSLNRALDLPMRGHNADLFDQAHGHLTAHGADQGRPPFSKSM